MARHRRRKNRYRKNRRTVTYRRDGIPEWLKSKAPAQASGSVSQAAEQPAAAQPAGEDALPDWLQSLTPTGPVAGATFETSQPEPQSSGNDLPSNQPQPYAPTGNAPQLPEQPVVVQPAGEDALPDWLQSLTPRGTVAGAASETPQPESQSSGNDSLSNQPQPSAPADNTPQLPEQPAAAQPAAKKPCRTGSSRFLRKRLLRLPPKLVGSQWRLSRPAMKPCLTGSVHFLQMPRPRKHLRLPIIRVYSTYGCSLARSASALWPGSNCTTGA